MNNVVNKSLLVLSCALSLSFPLSSPAQWSIDPAVNTPICTAEGDQTTPVIATDGTDGAIIAWKDFRVGGDTVVYAQRIDVNGALRWTLDGIPVSGDSGDPNLLRIIPDGAGGAIIAWIDWGDSSGTYLQRIDSFGTRLWGADGIRVFPFPIWDEGWSIISDSA